MMTFSMLFSIPFCIYFQLAANFFPPLAKYELKLLGYKSPCELICTPGQRPMDHDHILTWRTAVKPCVCVRVHCAFDYCTM